MRSLLAGNAHVYEKRGGPPLKRVYLIPTVSLMMIDWLTTTIVHGCATEVVLCTYCSTGNATKRDGFASERDSKTSSVLPHAERIINQSSAHMQMPVVFHETTWDEHVEDWKSQISLWITKLALVDFSASESITKAVVGTQKATRKQLDCSLSLLQRKKSRNLSHAATSRVRYAWFEWFGTGHAPHPMFTQKPLPGLWLWLDGCGLRYWRWIWQDWIWRWSIHPVDIWGEHSGLPGDALLWAWSSVDSYDS